MCKKSKCQKCKSCVPKQRAVVVPFVPLLQYVQSQVSGAPVATAVGIFNSGVQTGSVVGRTSFGWNAAVGFGYF